MHPLLKHRSVQTGLIIGAAAIGFGGIALTGPKHPETFPQPVRIPHAPPADHAPPTSTVSPPASVPPSEDIPNPATTAPSSAPTLSPTSAPLSPAPSPPSVTPSTTAPVAPTFIVHVAGLVQRPAVYRVPATYRVYDVIRLAGGVRPGGDTDVINLAARLQDGEQIYIPPHTAVHSGVAFRQPAPPGRAPLAGPLATVPRTRTGDIRAATPGSYPPRAQKLTDPSQGTVDLNSAGPDELMKLPGIGPSTAAKIIDFRKTNGRFTSVEDVMNVKGIGPAKFAKMRPFLTAR